MNTSPTTLTAPQTRSIRRITVSWAALGFLLPNFLGLLLFTITPVLFSFCIIFTNSNLKQVPLSFLGLRNLTDLLWVRPLDQGSTAVQIAYLISAVLLAAGLALLLWAAVSSWRGRRIAGLLVCGLGVITVPHSLVTATPGWMIAGGVLAIIGLVLLLQEGGRQVGPALVPALMIVAGLVGVRALEGHMWSHYELRDPRFWKYLYNTLILMLGIPFSIAGSLAFALLLNNSFDIARRKRLVAVLLCIGCAVLTIITLQSMGDSALIRDLSLLGAAVWLVAALGAGFDVAAFRTLFYLPTFTSGVALMILWKSLYNPNTGMINALLVKIASAGTGVVNLMGAAWTASARLVDPAAVWIPLTAPGFEAMPQWLGSVVWAKPALIIMTIWTAIGGTNMLLYLAGLSNIPRELTDAAQVDGAGAWQRFVHITWPQLAPTTFFVCIMSIIGGLQGGFEQARVLTEGGPDGATTTLSYYIYNVFYQDLELGYGATIAWVLFGIIFTATAVNWKFGRSLEVNP